MDRGVEQGLMMMMTLMELGVESYETVRCWMMMRGHKRQPRIPPHRTRTPPLKAEDPLRGQ